MTRRRNRQKSSTLGASAEASPRSEIEFTEKFRRGAAILFPIAVLMHLLFTFGVWPSLVRPSLVVAGGLFVAGFAFRYVRRARIVLAVGSAYAWFFLVYTLGIAPSIGYLVLSDHRDWIPWAPLASAALLVTFLVYRVRLDLARDWSRPLDETPGIIIGTETATLWREYGRNRQSGLMRGALAMGLVFAPAMYFTYGKVEYRIITFVFAAHCVALLTTCVASWWVSYYIAVRRWETANDLALRLPPLE